MISHIPVGQVARYMQIIAMHSKFMYKLLATEQKSDKSLLITVYLSGVNAGPASQSLKYFYLHHLQLKCLITSVNRKSVHFLIYYRVLPTNC